MRGCWFFHLPGCGAGRGISGGEGRRFGPLNRLCEDIHFSAASSPNSSFSSLSSMLGDTGLLKILFALLGGVRQRREGMFLCLCLLSSLPQSDRPGAGYGDGGCSSSNTRVAYIVLRGGGGVARQQCAHPPGPQCRHQQVQRRTEARPEKVDTDIPGSGHALSANSYSRSRSCSFSSRPGTSVLTYGVGQTPTSGCD